MSAHPHPHQHASHPFTQLVEFSCKDAAAREELYAAWKIATAFVVEKEKGGVAETYEVYLPRNNAGGAGAITPEQENEVMALETYASKEILDSQHMGQPAIADFIKATAAFVSKPVKLTFLHHHSGFHTKGEAKEAEVRASGVKPHCLTVTLNFPSNAHLRKCVSIQHALTQWSLHHEPNCLSYEQYFATSEPMSPEDAAHKSTQLVIFERYLTFDDLMVGHVGSDAFKAFQAVLAKDEEAKPSAPGVLRHYTETAIGFIGKV